MGLIVNTNTTRQRNQKLVLDYVRRHGPISSASIAKELRVPAGTIARVAGSLVELGMLRPAKERKSNGVGKPPLLLEVNGDYALISGVELNELTMRIIISNFTGEVLSEHSLSTNDILENLFANTSAIISDEIRKINWNGGGLKWVGVGLSGVLSPDDGKIVQGFLPVGLPFKSSLEKSLGVPVTVGNDANCAVLAEKAFGAAIDCENIVCLLDRGWLGAGLYLNGSLYAGARNAAGELLAGLLSPRTRETARVSRFPFIESYGLERKIEESQCDIMNSKNVKSREALIKTLVGMAVEGESKAKEVLESEAVRFATAITRLSALFDPDLVMVSGDVAAGGSFMERLVLEKIIELNKKSKSAALQKNEVLCKFSTLHQRGVGLGAVSQALEALSDAALSE
jgi:glucokinase